jgi:ATP-dependent DNA helicase RecQ
MSATSPPSAELRDTLHTTFGHKQFRGQQEEVIQTIMEGKDVLHIAGTGSGKSLCFQMPAALGKKVLVVSPLIALMNDQVEKLKRIGIKGIDIHSLRENQPKVLEEIARKKYSLILTSPEQLQREPVVAALQEAEIEIMAVDEAHCISTWGTDFRPEFGELNVVRKKMNNPSVAGFTATATPQMEREIVQTLGMSDPLVFRDSALRENLSYSVHTVKDHNAKPRLIQQLIQQHAPNPNDATILYCGRKCDIDRYQTILGFSGLKAAIYHGDMANGMRKEMSEKFDRNDPRIMIATNAFGMGIDKPNVRLIVHEKITGSVQAYLQETGRAGRDGKPAHCALLFAEKQDLELQEFFLEQKTPSILYVHGVYKVLRELCENRACSLGQSFGVDMFKLYRRFDTHQYRNKAKFPVQNDGKVNASFGILRSVGAIEKDRNGFVLHEFNEGSSAYKIAEQMTLERKRLHGALWQQMLSYAQNKKPTQELLVEMLETEV